ncbi:MAG: NAD(P)-dependent methylenetetrahydromethanopterin dehydrogenase [Gammaproteobacteria bacterium]
MEKRTIIHMFDPMPHTSPFDINMAVDAGFETVIPYNNVQLDNIYRLVRDAIFSRGPAGVRRTGIFIGGRDIGLAMAMLDAARKAMVPHFEVSVFADPSGAFTTAAALVASVEKQLKDKYRMDLSGCRAVVFGGTGPVGIATGVIASLHGANTTIVDHVGAENVLNVATEYNRLCGSSLRATYGASDADKAFLVANADIVFCTAKAGVEVLNAAVLACAKQLKVAGDVNAVMPFGIEGIKLEDCGTPIEHATASPGAVGIGALAVGNVKYRLQQGLLRSMLEANEAVFFDFRDAFKRARTLV